MGALINPRDIYPVIFEKRRLEISESTYASFRSCARKLEHRKLLRNNDRVRSEAGEVGQALHEAYQAWWLHGDRDYAIFRLGMEYPWDLIPSMMDPRGFPASFAALNALMDYGKDGKELAYIDTDQGRIAAIEVPFEIIFSGIYLVDPCDEFPEGIPFVWRGFIDTVLRSTFNQEFIIEDLKTTRTTDKDRTAAFRHKWQALIYAIVLSAVTGQPLHSFTVLYKEVYIDALRPKVRPYEFTKTQSDIVEFGRTLVWDLFQIRAMFERCWFPRNPNSCEAFGRPCQFFDDCDSNDRSDLLFDAQHLSDSLVNQKDVRDEEWKPTLVTHVDLSELAK